MSFKKILKILKFYLQIYFYLEKTFLYLKIEKKLDGKFQMVNFNNIIFRFRVWDHKLIYHRIFFFPKESIKVLCHLIYIPSGYLGKVVRRRLFLTG